METSGGQFPLIRPLGQFMDAADRRRLLPELFTPDGLGMRAGTRGGEDRTAVPRRVGQVKGLPPPK